MNLIFHPTHPQFPGIITTLPVSWKNHIVPWAQGDYIKADFGEILIQQMVCKDFGIYVWSLAIQKPVCLYPTAGTPTIALQFTLEGHIPCILRGFGSKVLEKGNYEMFYVPIGHNEARFEPGRYESLHIELQPRYLEELTEIRPQIRDLIFRLQSSSSKGMPMAVARINYITSSILQNLKTCARKGPALQLEMHKYILELLSEYLGSILRAEEDKGKNILLRPQMMEIRDHILLAPNIHEHTLENLAKHFNISETMLKRHFKASFGINISEFVHTQALEKGYYLLTTTNRTIADVAYELGYSWRYAFEDAFKKHYGCSPSSLRNDLNS
jgi:AraC-like DNA-binding protein